MPFKLLTDWYSGQKVVSTQFFFPKKHFNQIHLINITELLFPILDIIRLAVRHEHICSVLVKPDFVQKLIESCSYSAANQLMITRCFVNMLNHTVGITLVKSRFLDIVRELRRIKQGNGNLQVCYHSMVQKLTKTMKLWFQIAISSFYLNVTTVQLQLADQEMCRLTTEGLLELLKWISDLEAIYRSYQSFGNLTCTPNGPTTSAQIISVDVVVDKIRYYMSAALPYGFEKLNEIARDLTAAL